MEPPRYKDEHDIIRDKNENRRKRPGRGGNIVDERDMAGFGSDMMGFGPDMNDQRMMGQMPHNMMGIGPDMMGQNVMGGGHNMDGGSMMGRQNMMGPGSNMMMWNQPYVEPMNPQFSEFGMGMNAMMNEPIQPPAPKQPFYFSQVTLYPPEPSQFYQSKRERPPCCHTVFVGGLPQNATVEHLKEVFSKCGSINNLRINKKHFAHIRFDQEETVDHAIYLSGYRMVLQVEDKPSEEHEDTGRMFVDYSDDREDKYLAECQQRQAARELRHMQRLEMDRNRPPSPTPVLAYTSLNMNTVSEEIKQGGEKLADSLQIVISWLERGDCSRTSVNAFYGVIQSVNVQVRRLHTDKTTMETEINELKDKFRLTFETILHQLGQIDQVYVSATKQKAWDNFSKAQRKNIQAWQKQVQATYSMLQADYTKLYQSSEEMDMSDDEAGDNSGVSASKQARKDDSDLVELVELRQENRSLMNQLDAYKNEVEVLKVEAQKGESNSQAQVRSLQQALQGMQQQLILAKQNVKAYEIRDKQRETAEADSIAPKLSVEKDHEEKEKDSTKAEKESTKSEKESTKRSSENELVIGANLSIPGLHDPPSRNEVNIKQAKLIGLMSCFLNVHPNGASIDYIWSYLNQLDVVATSRDIEDLLLAFPSIFSQHSHGVGAFLERRWHLGIFATNMMTPIIR